ncbi:MAG: DUF2845 domain-containing protein [Pseudomonadota bacterium]
MRAILAMIVAAVLIIPIVAHAETNCRCGNAIVSAGNSTAEVRAKCGEPDSIEKEEVEETSNSEYENTLPQERGGSEVSPQRIAKKTTTKSRIERWTYNMGARKFIKFLEFKGGKLVSVDTGGYGTGHQRVFPRR